MCNLSIVRTKILLLVHAESIQVEQPTRGVKENCQRFRIIGESILLIVLNIFRVLKNVDYVYSSVLVYLMYALCI